MPILRPAPVPNEVFITGRLSREVVKLLAAHANVRSHVPAEHITPAMLCHEVHTATALVTFLYDTVDRKVIDAGPNLRVIANLAVGHNNIDVEYACARGIWVTNTPGVLTEATADGAMALLLAVARHIVPADRFVRKGKFKRWEFNMFLGQDLNGRKLGIIGMGAIGQAVARRAAGFGMQILYNNRTRLNAALETRLGVRHVSLVSLLRQSDAISVHVPLNDATFHLLGAEEFGHMKTGALLVNTSRGPVVDERALVDALRDGKLGGAGLDVFEREPAVEKELLTMDNVVLSPHIASATSATRAGMSMMAAKNVIAVLRGRRPPNPVCVPQRRPS